MVCRLIGNERLSFCRIADLPPEPRARSAL